MINISLQAEYVAQVAGVNITNSFLTTLLVSLILIICAFIFALTKKSNNFIVQSLSVLVFELLKLTDKVTGDREMSKKILPLIITFFIFIFSANLLAMIPGFLGSLYMQTPAGTIPFLRSPNSDLTTTLALALCSVFSIQFFSLRTLGIKNYLKRFFNFQGPLQFMLGFFEIVSESVKILSFSMRLFGNIFAGEILLLVMAFIVPYLIPVPFMILEVFVGIIQAFIFAMLTLAFIRSSITRHVVSAGVGK